MLVVAVEKDLPVAECFGIVLFHSITDYLIQLLRRCAWMIDAA